jgi:four helix bundle protein
MNHQQDGTDLGPLPESRPEPESEKRSPVYDLEERSSQFGEAIIDLCKTIRIDVITHPLVSQIRSATSIGANYCEGDEAISKKEFRVKIGYCKKESRETKFWLRMLARAVESKKDELRTLWREAHELHLIFCTIYRKCSRITPPKGPKDL